MSKANFNIFGIPDGFDLFEGSATDKDYFQVFYDNSKENSKLTIHRKMDGAITYTYLRYNLYSAAGRTGSFIGMSVAFQSLYCNDLDKLYRLFDTVYTEVLLKKQKIIEPVLSNPKIQAKYLIRTFKDQEEEILSLKSIILKNIEERFVENILPVDETFTEGKPGLIRKLNSFDTQVPDIVRTYAWVSISPNFQGLGDEITGERIKDWEKLFQKTKDFIIENQFLLSSNPGKVEKDVSARLNEINSIFQAVKSFSQRQVGLKDLETQAVTILSQLRQLKKLAERPVPTSVPKPETPVEPSTEHTLPAVGGNEKGSDYSKQIKYAISSIGVLFLIGCAYWALNYPLIPKNPPIDEEIPFQDTTEERSCKPCATHESNFNKWLEQNEFEQASKEIIALKKLDQDVTTVEATLFDAIDAEIKNAVEENTEQGWDTAIKLHGLLKSELPNMFDQQKLTDCTERKRLVQATLDLEKATPKYDAAIQKCESILKSDCSPLIKDEAELLKTKAESAKKGKPSKNNGPNKVTEKGSESGKSTVQCTYVNGKEINNGSTVMTGEIVICKAVCGSNLCDNIEWTFEPNKDIELDNSTEKSNPIRFKGTRAYNKEIKIKSSKGTVSFKIQQ